MPKTSLKLEDVYVTYDHDNDVFQVTSKDGKLGGNRFNITLSQTSETEQNLRKMFVEQGLINDSLMGNLPPRTFRPKEIRQPDTIYLGMTIKGLVEWKPVRENLTPVLFISGEPGSGKTFLMEEILEQAVNKDGKDNVFLIKGDYGRKYDSFPNFANKDNIINNSREAKKLLEYLLKFKFSPHPSYVFIDEIFSNILQVSDRGLIGEVEGEIHDMLLQMFKLARSKNIHFIISSTDFNGVDSLYKIKIPLHIGSKIFLGNMTKNDSYEFFNRKITKEQLNGGTGKGFISLQGEIPTVFQSFLREDPQNRLLDS